MCPNIRMPMSEKTLTQIANAWKTQIANAISDGDGQTDGRKVKGNIICPFHHSSNGGDIKKGPHVMCEQRKPRLARASN